MRFITLKKVKAAALTLGLTALASGTALANAAVPQAPAAAAPAAPAAPAATAAAAPEGSNQALSLHIINKTEFCGKLEQAFVNLATASGVDRAHTAMLASGAAPYVVDEFRSGRASDYIRAAVLRTLGNMPPAPQDQTYLPLATVIGSAMGLGNNVSLALSSGELRYIPSAQHGTDLVVIAQNAAAMNDDRMRKVAEIAKAQEIHISVIWVGSQTDSQDKLEARSLGWVAAMTGGSFVNLGGQGNPCGAGS